MGHGNDTGDMAARRAGQESVPRLAGSHFHGNFLFAGQSPHVRPIDHTWQPKTLRRGANQSLVCIAGASPKLMVEVGNTQLPAVKRSQAMKHFEQHHRVHAAGHGNEYGLTRLQETPVSNGCFDALNQIDHGAMLGISAPLTSGLAA